jgi:hypothetical protein
MPGDPWWTAHPFAYSISGVVIGGRLRPVVIRMYELPVDQ